MKKHEGIFYRINDLRLLYRKNKLFFIVAGVCLLIGLALAIRFCCLQTEKKEALSLAGYITAGEYPFGKIFVFIILLPILLCASILLLSFNYYSIFAFYLELIIASYIVFKNNLLPVFCSFLPGICTLCLFIMPIMLVNAFFITILWTEVYSVVDFPCGKRIFYILPYRCHIKITKKSFFRCVASILCFNAVFTALISLLFLLIF